MLHDWGVIAAAFAYIGLLFGVASYGDRLSPSQRGRASMLIYPLSLAIYCTSWTFFGSVGFATRTSIDFLAIYVGPILMIGLCTPLLRRVIQLAKSQNITSIADFIAARYGKSQAVAVAGDQKQEPDVAESGCDHAPVVQHGCVPPSRFGAATGPSRESL